MKYFASEEMKRNGRGKRYLIHTVLSFVSLIRRTIYFDSRSFPIFELRCRFVRKKFQYVWNKQNIPWKLLERFLFTSCDASKSHSFAPLTRWFFDALQLMNIIVRTHDGIIYIVIYLDFHSTKWALWLVDSWSRAPDHIQMYLDRDTIA